MEERLKTAIVGTSFTNVANKVAAARAQLSVAPSTYPLSGHSVLKSRPEWYTSPYTGAKIDTGLTVQVAGDVGHSKNP